MQVLIKNVSKAFKKEFVLRNIDLKINENEIFGLIGPSGAGKTTLIRLIIGALNVDKGVINVGRYTIPDFNALKEIGYMPQNDALYDDISGYDNLMFFGGMYTQDRDYLKARVNEVLHLVELENDSSKHVINYSGGMKKRLSLSLALLHSPKLLLLDEPTVGIDPLLRLKIWDEFKALKAQGKTLIVTTHVMDEAVKCDRLGLIYHGAIIACDTVEALLSRSYDNSIESLFFESGEKE